MEIKKLYETNEQFKKDVQGNSRQVLMNRIGLQSRVEEVLSVGIEYVLEELSFMLAYNDLDPKTKPIADHGKTKFVYIYYEPWNVFEKCVNGEYGNAPKEGIGFVIAKIVDLGN